MNGQPLLSILIPTYNGTKKFLSDVLDYLVKGISLCDCNEIEVIISNNASTDETEKLLCQYDSYPYIKHYTNNENVGFARNIILLTDKYANGIYGWVIGDDDLIQPRLLPCIMDILRNNEYDYLSMGFHEIRKQEEMNSREISNPQVVSSTFAEALNHNKSSLGTFMSSSIFRISMFRSVSKGEITANFDTFKSIFPNGYINASAFHDKKCAYFTEEAVYPIVHSKDWASSDNSYMIYTRIMPEFYMYILSLNVKKNELAETYNRILCSGLWSGYLRLSHFAKVDKYFFSLFGRSLFHPRVHFLVISKLFGKIRNKC